MDLGTLNERLALALGTNPYGEGVFRWEHSDNLFWPEFPTGRMISKTAEVPIIGGATCPDCKGSGEGWPEDDGICSTCDGAGKIFKERVTAVVGPEYTRKEMAPNLHHQWVVTIWYPPEKLAQWQANFPGAPYPSRGYRIHTNASLPSYEGGPREPNLAETERFIQLIRHQRSETYSEVVNGMLAEDDKRRSDSKKEIADELLDDLPAFMNTEPGARGGYVSFPYTKKDRIQ